MDNKLKSDLAEGRLCSGVWLTLCSAAVAEIAGHSGVDWCLIDAEHGPNTLTTIADQLRALAGTPAEAVVRVPAAEEWMLKQVLDLGATSVLVPMIDTAAQAEAVVAATRYAPSGRRGMGAALARASGFGAEQDYVAKAEARLCVMVQAESALALRNIDAISAVEGVDCVFIGPADLSADMGYPGQPSHPEVVAQIDAALPRIRAAGKAAGIVTFDPEEARAYAAKGVTFLGVGADSMVLGQGMRALGQTGWRG